MKVCLSVDMEGISQITNPLAVKAFCKEYWNSGQRAMQNEVIAAAEGLKAGGADEIVVLDNHGSGNTYNLVNDGLPAGARLETWNVFDLRSHDVEAMLQLGYHARCGPVGFIAHTYVGGLRLRAGGEFISESHGRAWASRVPLLGIIGNDTHAATLGSLDEVPFLTVQQTVDRGDATPAFDDPREGLEAIRDFAAQALRDHKDAPTPDPPRQFLFEASIPEDMAIAQELTKASWARRSATEYEVELQDWSEARAPLAAAMAGAVAPYRTYFPGGELRSRATFESWEAGTLQDATRAYSEWINEQQEEWLV
jgi:D-amino peptidase